MGEGRVMTKIRKVAAGLVLAVFVASGVKVLAEGPYWCYMECAGCTFEATSCEYCYFNPSTCTTTRYNCEGFSINCGG
jgi:hypothetical protein